MILMDEDRFDPGVPDAMDLLGEEMAYAVFPGYGVEILLCDEHFEPYTTYAPYPQVY